MGTPNSDIVTLTPYSRLNPLTVMRQAGEARGLVHKNQSWFMDHHPDTARRYRDSLAAARNILRIAYSEDTRAFIVHTEEEPIGFATIILGRRISWGGNHDAHVYGGADLDYTLTPRYARPDIHRATADRLVDQAVQMHIAPKVTDPYGGIDRDINEAYFPALCVVPVGRTDKPTGLMEGLPDAQFELQAEAVDLSADLEPDDPARYGPVDVYKAVISRVMPRTNYGQ